MVLLGERQQQTLCHLNKMQDLQKQDINQTKMNQNILGFC